MLTFSHASQPTNEESIKEDVGEGYSSPEKTPSELRTFDIPGYIVDEEQKRLKLSGTEDWQDMLQQTRSRLDI